MNKILMTFCAAAAMASCATQNTADINGEWNITKALGTTVVADKDMDAPFLGFNTKDNQLYGTTSCNRLSGHINIDSKTKDIDFGATGSTQMMCHDMKTEELVLGALAKTRKFSIDNNTLLFTDEAGNVVMELIKK